jgi:DNA-directed RNA polymerase subunit RPC12/RpoP
MKTKNPELLCAACGYKILSLKTVYLDPKTGDFYHRECGIAIMKMGKKNPSGEYFVDYDEKTGLWCVFHTDKKTGFAHATLCSKEEAEVIAEKMNKKHNNPAKTVAQQKLFAIALGIKKGQIARSYSAEAAKMADRMSVRKLEEFASTRFENPTHRCSKCGKPFKPMYLYDEVCYTCRTKGSKLQKNILPELATLALTGFGIGLGYKTAGAAWDKVAGKKKNPVLRCPNCSSSSLHKDPVSKLYTCQECGSRSMKVSKAMWTEPQCLKAFQEPVESKLLVDVQKQLQRVRDTMLRCQRTWV